MPEYKERQEELEKQVERLSEKITYLKIEMSFKDDILKTFMEIINNKI
jgi:hypothetical protein